MKFKCLTIHNIASIRDAVIDFDSPQLAGADVFLISGETGAGKSTILDCISLALYARIPRLSSSTTDVPGADAVKVNDPCQLLRRGEKEGYAEVDFVSNDGRPYRVRWSVTRTKKHKNDRGKVYGYNDSRQLTDLTDGATFIKKGDVEREIARLAGMDFTQFCRTTMLAQGEFTKFLKASKSEKGAILEKLTGLEIYGKIGRRVYDEYSARQRAYDAANSEIEGRRAGLLTDEVRQEHTAAINELDAQITAAQKILDTREAIERWLGRETELIKAHRDAEADYRRHCGIAAGALAAAQISLGARRKEAESMDELIAAHSRRSEIYKMAGSVISDIRLMTDTARTIAEKERRISDIIRDADTQADRLEDAAKAYEKSEAAVKAADKSLQARRKDLEAMDIKSLRERAGALLEERERTTAAMLRLKTCLDTKAARLKDEQTVAELQAAVDLLAVSMTEAIARAETTKNQYEVKDKEYRFQSRTLDRWAAEIRASLSEGDICPVCRRKITEKLPSEAEIRALLSVQERELTNLKAAYDKLHGEAVKIKTEHDAKELSRDALVKKLDSTKADFDKICREAPETTVEALETSLARLRTEVESTRKTLAAAEAVETDVRSKENELTALGRRLHECDVQRTKIAESVKNLAERKKSLDEEIAEGRQRCAELKRSYLSIASKFEWHHSPETEPTEFAIELKAALDSFNILQQRRASLDAELRQSESLCSSVVEALAAGEALLGNRPEAVESGTTLDRALRNLFEAAAVYRQSRETIAMHRKARPEMDENETLESVRAAISVIKTEQAERSDTRTRMQADLDRDAALRQELQSRIEVLETCRRERDRWARLNNLIGDATGNKFREAAQRYLLSDLVRTANHYMEQLSDRYRLHVPAHSWVIMVADDYQGGVMRAADTISGGESFLVSLALALALSNVGHNICADTLFIDEGFGTLSGEALQNAVQTLRTLRTRSGRHVGIISHVDELRETIPVQILLTRNPDRSSSTISVEVKA